MAKIKESYICSHCGAKTLQWLGKCPACNEWNTLEPVTESAVKNLSSLAAANLAMPLAAVPESGTEPFPSGLEALDRVLGNGLVPGASILVGGEPGIGKSTLLLQLAQAIASQGRTVLYASGEEGLGQIRNRALRLGSLAENLLAMSTSRVEEVMAMIEEHSPAFVVADSVQTLASQEADGLPGNVSQVRAVATRLVEVCAKKGACLVLVGHVTKDGALAGPRLLEHMVDTVIALEGDRRQMFRLLRVFKNRFGPNEELLVFQMRKTGLELVPDPSTFFLGARNPELSGTALVMAVDGHRPLVVEVQALVSRSYLTIPRRAALGFDANRLHLLLAVLEKRLKISFGQADIYAKVSGGIKINEPGTDIAVISALLSSYYDVPLPEKSIFWGELDLNGQIRPVAAHAQRLSQARRLGFEPIVFPAGVAGENKGGHALEDIRQLQTFLFKKRSQA